eukprot:scaffold14569_cov49-Cyclotella_meneghiniana.AAC.5
MRLVGGDSPHRALMAAVAGPQYHPDLHDMDDIHAMGSAIWGNISNNNTNNIADVRSNINREAANRSSGTSNDDAVDLESDDSDDSYVNIDGSAIPTNNNNNSNNNNAPSLSAMFSPPTHLMHRAGGFQGARNVAKDARRWLLVNVQDDGDFACHALNRDVWREELVENLSKEACTMHVMDSCETLKQTQAALFKRVHMSTNPEGQTYITRYKVEGYPHLAIIDPRTGALLWRKEGWTQVNPLTAEQFVEIASDFCSRHSFSKQPAPAKHGYNSSNTQSSNKRPIQELSEEEQLQAAIRASMMPENDEMDEEGTNDVDKSMENRVENEENDDDDAKPAALNSFEQEILALEVGDEPTSGNVARIQIRMPDGKRLVRKFQGDDSVKIIYAFVAQSNDEAKSGKAFELKAKFPPQDLLSSVDESISSCGLNGEAINVMWK